MTGGRISVGAELGLFNYDFDKNKSIFRPGKNQKGKPRKVKMPPWHMKELKYYLSTSPYHPRKLFPFSADSFNREFNEMRPLLGPDFTRRRSDDVKAKFGGKNEYVIQIKGIRKTYMTKIWWDLVPTFGKEGAAQIVAAKMRHSSVNITWKHYIREFENPEFKKELDRYRFKPIADIIHVPSQEVLADSLPPPLPVEKPLGWYDEGSFSTRLWKGVANYVDEDED